MPRLAPSEPERKPAVLPNAWLSYLAGQPRWACSASVRHYACALSNPPGRRHDVSPPRQRYGHRHSVCRRISPEQHHGASSEMAGQADQVDRPVPARRHHRQRHPHGVAKGARADRLGHRGREQAGRELAARCRHGSQISGRWLHLPDGDCSPCRQRHAVRRAHPLRPGQELRARLAGEPARLHVAGASPTRCRSGHRA